MNFDTEIHIMCENIKRLRIISHLSKKEMANKLKISVKALTFIENGILPERLSCTILFNIYRNFGIHPKDILSKIISLDGYIK